MLRKTLVRGKRGLSLAIALAICSSLPVYAIEAPNAGTIADSVKERGNVVSPKANVQIEVSEDQAETEPAKEGFKFPVNSYYITGIEDINDLALREDKLQDLVQDATNKELTLAELKAVARRIAKYFQEHGYMVAHAYIPAQKLKDGVVEISVAPGKYGNVELRNHSRLSDSTARKMLGSIDVGSYVKKAQLERTLLLLSDTGGISIKANLEPGKTTGTTTLIVDIKNTDALTADLSMNNYGNRFTGKVLRSFNLDAHNLSGSGDQLKMHINNSGGGLTSAGIDYVVPIGGRGFQLGLGYEHLRYSLGQDFESLDAYGTAKNTSVYGLYPLVRSRNYNLYAQIGYSDKGLEDRIDGEYFFTQRSAKVWTLGLSGDSRDQFHGGGVNDFALTLATGRLNIDGGQVQSESAQDYDRLGAQTAGSFTKANLNFSRLQYLSARTNLFLGFSGQLASKNLDSAEKMYLGGAYGVRAYPQGEAAGDQGYLLTGELRYQLSNPALQLVAFIDHGHTTINKNPWDGAGDNSRTLTSAGIGAIYNHSKAYTLRVDYAWKLGDEEAISDDDKNARLWVKGTRYF